MFKSQSAYYVLTHTPTGVFYIGSTRDLYRRMNNHRSSLAAGNHYNSRLQEVFTDWDDIDVDWAYCDSVEQAEERERSTLSRCFGMPNCSNAYETPRAKMGETGGGWKASPETIERRRIAATGRTHSQSTREKLSQINTGRRMSDETRRKMSDAKGGVFVGEICDWTGRTHSEESIQKMRESSTGKVHTDETREKIRAFAETTGRRVSVDGVVYATTSAAARAHSIDHRTVRGRIASTGSRFADWFYVE